MKNKLLSALLLVCVSAAPLLTQAQGFIGNGSSTGIKAVNSSGTLPGVNVGIGVATPAVGTTLEVADPGGSALGLRFDALPATATPYVLYYDGSAVVTYGPAPAASISSVNYDCGIGTVTVNGVTSAEKAWLLSGATTVPASYFGTFNDDDIRIATNNSSCNYASLKEKMVIGSETNNGNISIGWDGVTAPPVGPGNSKILVQNGTVSATPYAPLTGLGLAGSDINIFSYANNKTTGNNAGVVSVVDAALPLGVGYIALVSNATSNNVGAYMQIDGNGAQSTGISLDIGGSSTTTMDNKGLEANVTGSTVQNTGVSANAQGPANFLNTGVSGNASGCTYTNYNNPQGNIGVWGNAFSGPGVANTVNTAVKGDAYGDGSYNCGFMTNSGGNTNAINVGGALLCNGDNNNSWAGPGSYFTGWQANVGYFAYSRGINSINIGGVGQVTEGTDVYGLIGSSTSNDCNSQIGVWGYISSAPNSSIANYAVRGTAPYGGIGGGVFSPANSTSPVAPSYAGYFEGDVFATNTYYYSDPKLKENISDFNGALDLLGKLSIKRYTFKNSEYPHMNLPQGEQVGVLSSDLKKVCPGLVKPAVHLSTGKDDKQVSFEAVNYNALIPVLVQAVKELDAKPENPELAKTVADQAQQIADQSKQITELRSLLEDLCTNGCAGFSPAGAVQTSPSQSAALYQSVPNPTSGKVSIGYSINMAFTNAMIRIATIDGKSVADYKITGMGSGSVLFDASAMAAGVYKYYLTIDDKAIDTKSMVITSK